MERARWSLQIEGDYVPDLRVHPETGHILVSTSAQGPTTVSKSPGLVLRRLGSPVSRGSVLITKAGLLAAHRPPDGAWRLTDSVDPGEVTASIAAPSEWGHSSRQSRTGALRIGLVDFALVGSTLSRFASDGTLLSRVDLPVDTWRAAMYRTGPAAVARFRHFFRAQKTWDLTHDLRRDRIIAWAWAIPGWVSAISLDGALEWVTVPTIDCCNFVRLLPREDLVAPMSSCGRRLTFISGDGETRGVRDFDEAPTAFFADGEGGMIVGFVAGGLAACAADGKQKWTLDCQQVRNGIVDGGVMYVVTAVEPGLLEVNALDLDELR